jgi:5'-nucleotidase/UDP-sugar diphosphatase
LPEVLGTINVNLDANKEVVRTQESLIGNMICDALKSELDRRGEIADFVVLNGGAIRFSPSTRPSGIYPAGPITSHMVDEMLPFGDANIIVTMSGKELKRIFERSVAQLPQAEGPFLQVSKELTITIDTSQQAQIINDLVDPPIIVTEGKRITSIKINHAEFDTAATYRVAASTFLAEEKGNDGYVVFRNIPAARKVDLGDDQALVVKQYIKLKAPLTPVIQGRIVYK